MKRVLTYILLPILALMGVLVFRALTLQQEAIEILEPVEVQVPPGAVERFAESITFPTISHGDPTLFDPVPFGAFRDFLAEAFPLVHENLELELVGDHSLLFSWPGSEQMLDPVILMAHYDVVPIEEGTEGDWTFPPFSGEVVEDTVWGRGAMDDKATLMAILESAEVLLAREFQPARSFLFSFGHDEEIGGLAGARAVASLIADRGIRASYVLDEGMVITDGNLPGVEGAVALFGLAEKGYLSVRLTVDAGGGHSSTPPPETAVGILAGAISRLEGTPMPARLDGPTRMLLETLASQTPFAMRLVTANLWLFEGVVAGILAGTPETDASIRTTTAPTMLRAGVKDNILPQQAFGVVNFRIIPGDTPEGVLQHIEEVIDDPRVQVEVYQGPPTFPSPVSRTDSYGYRELRSTVQEIFPGTAVAPFITLGGTDSKHFVDVADDVYRFAPFRLRPGLQSGIHGTNERIPVGDYLDMIRFFTRLMERAG